MSVMYESISREANHTFQPKVTRSMLVSLNQANQSQLTHMRYFLPRFTGARVGVNVSTVMVLI